jgi:PAS domain S-box-containing protein
MFMSDDKLPAFYGEDQESLQVLLQDEFLTTETLDFSRLLPDAVTLSGSFDFREVPEATVARLWDVLPLSILIVNRPGVITYVNRFCANLLGKSQEWIDRPFTAIFPNRVDTDKIARLLETVYSDRRPVMVECSLEPDGRRIWTRIHLRSLRFRNERLVLVFLEDLTAEKTGLFLTEKYKRLVQVFPIGIAEFALASPVPIRGRLEGLLKGVAEASLIGGNHEFALMSGFAEIQEAKGVRLGRIFSFRGPSLNMFRAWIKGGCQIASLETKEFSSSGSVTYYADTVVGNVEGGILVGVWMMRNDITQRRLVEETLREKSDQLAQYSRTLEAQVKERTRYLEQSQRRLEDYATKLEGANEALRMLIDGVEQQKKDREKKLRDSLKYSAKPLLDQLLTQPLSERAQSIVHSLITNLDTIAASLGTERVQNWELLTLREIRICEMIASGLTSKEIAEVMGVSPQTIFSHRTHIRRKLGLCGSDDDLASKLRNPNP